MVGSRPKWSRWRSSLISFESLALLCPGVSDVHPHAPWGASNVAGRWVFATASEAEYSDLLCSRAAMVVKEFAQSRGYSFPPAPSKQSSPPAPSQQLGLAMMPYTSKDSEDPWANKRAAAGLQPRGRRVTQLVPEGKRLHTFFLPANASLHDKLSQLGNSKMKVLRQVEAVDNSGTQVTVVIPWLPTEFMLEASRCWHPFETIPTVDSFVAANFIAYLHDPLSMVNWRIQQIRDLQQRGKSLQATNDKLLAASPPTVQRILAGKNMELLRQLLLEIDWPDTGLVAELLAGTVLTGVQPESNVFAHKEPTQALSLESLRQAAKWTVPKVAALTRASGDLALDAAVWHETGEELASGWLLGPFSSEALDAEFPAGWLPARRFGVTTGSGATTKVRVIDDYSLPQTNSGYSSRERIHLDDIDSVAGLAKFMVMKAKALGVPLEVLGRTLDLKAAYRQIAVSPESAWCAIISVYSPPAQRALYYKQVALPFGSTASVHIFNRLARALWALGVRLLGLSWCNYFDDYPLLEGSSTLVSARVAAEGLMKILGWRVSQSPDKQLAFSPTFGLLGVEMDLTRSSVGQIVLRNKPSRVLQLQELTAAILAKGVLGPSDAASLRGKFQYAEGQSFGKAAAAALRVVSSRAHQHSSEIGLSDDLRGAIRWLADHVLTCAPRRLPMPGHLHPAVVFSDGAFEPALGGAPMQASCGAVLMIAGRCVEHISESIPSHLLDRWLAGRKQPISQIELIPVLLARRVWKQRCVHHKWLFFVDNDGARENLVRGDSNSEFNQRIVQAVMAEELSQPGWPWFSRVATLSNISDGPSRLDCSQVEALGSTRVSVPSAAWLH